jgi:hypothetical protein
MGYIALSEISIGNSLSLRLRELLEVGIAIYVSKARNAISLCLRNMYKKYGRAREDEERGDGLKVLTQATNKR